MKTDSPKPKKAKLTRAERAAKHDAARHLLAEARDGGSLIVVRRSFKKQDGKKVRRNSIGGYVVGMSGAWVLIHEVNRDTLAFNGYTAVRVRDIAEAWRDTSFIGEYLRKSELYPVSQPDILLADLPGLLSSANVQFPLIGLSAEMQSPERYQVGRIGATGQTYFTLIPVGSSGRWQATERLRFEDITSVTFGGGYEKGLWQMAQDEWPRRQAHARKESGK